jgi:elongator complex protein 3
VTGTSERRKRILSNPIPEEYFSELIDLIVREQPASKGEVHSLKLALCKIHHLPRIPTDPEVLEHVPSERRNELLPFLRIKAMRTASGVSPVAVMTSPADCPHGTCIYCPGGVGNNSAQSYTGQEPAALRAGQHGFDPFLQTEARLRQYREIGHPTDKIDLIIMGGTFPAREPEYQEKFVLGCFNAMNSGTSPVTHLPDAHIRNESAPHRCVGMTIETRPDHCLGPQIEQIRRLGGTRVELGVQTTSDEVLELVKRGHGTQATRESTRMIKDAGLKLVYHMMPGLPGSTPEMDLESFRTIFSNPEYRPDMLKIYPTLVVKGTKLHTMWEQGEYEPLTTSGAVDLLKEVKKLIPRYVRVQRIQRDIPAKLIEAGVMKSNLRQLVQLALEKEGERCHCIRCREAGHTRRTASNVRLMETSYESSGGMEHFLSFEDPDSEVLVGFLRLREPSEGSEFGKQKCSIVRELRITGIEVPLESELAEMEEGGDEKSGSSPGVGNATKRFQHTGYGQKLLERAEELSRELGMSRIAVTSGVGVRPYYRKFGYDLVGHSMEKQL